MLQAFALAALDWAGHIQYWHVAVLATVYGIANTLDLPARQSFVVQIVGKNDLINAIALNSAVFNGARVVGPAVAGLLVARYGVAIAFLLNGLSFLGVIGALLAIHNEGEPRPRAGDSLGPGDPPGTALCVGDAAHRAHPRLHARDQPLRRQLRGGGASRGPRSAARGRARLRAPHGLPRGRCGGRRGRRSPSWGEGRAPVWLLAGAALIDAGGPHGPRDSCATSGSPRCSSA